MKSVKSISWSSFGGLFYSFIPQSEIHYGEECPLNYTRLYPGATPEKVNNKPLRLGKWRGKNYEIKQSKEMV